MKLHQVLVVLAASMAAAVNPGVEVQINESFLTYLKNTALAMLTGVIEGQSIAQASGKDGIIDWELDNIKVTKFSAPTSNVQLPLTPPHGLTIKLEQISVSLTASYHLTEHLIFKVHESGTVDITATADASLDLQIDEKTQRPYITVGACTSNIDNLHLEFHGGMFNKILDLLKGVIEKMVKSKMGGIVCTEIESIATTKINPLLSGIPVTTEIVNGVFLDYSFVGDAEIVGNTIELPFLGKIYAAGHENDAGIPQASAMPAIPNVSQHMCFKLNMPEIIGSGFYAGIASNTLHLVLTETELTNLKLPGLLSCSCTSGPMCLVAYFPGLNKICTAGHSLGMEISMKVLPKVTSTSQGIIIQFTGEAAFTYNNVPYVTLQAVAAAGIAPGDLSFDDWTIKAAMQAQAGTMSVLSKNPAIGDIPVATLNSLWQTVIGLIFQGQLDKLGAQGFHIPGITEVVPAKATFIMSADSLAMCDDFALHL